MTIEFELCDRFVAAAREWGDRRLMDDNQALETKAEQALLEIEHLVSGATDVTFDVENRTVRHEASDELATLLSQQANDTDLSEAELLKLHVELFSGAFQDDDTVRPPNTPREEDLP